MVTRLNCDNNKLNDKNLKCVDFKTEKLENIFFIHAQSYNGDVMIFGKPMAGLV
jgi:hypothetical protein